MLLTACPLRTGPVRYRVVVGEEIPVDRSIGRKEFARKAVIEFARRLEARIKSAPADWQGWSYWAPPDA